MSEESPENYNSGDIVWVKLGSSWWPGEVKDTDELPNDVVDFKKPPLVIVKFFDEDSYEYVKTWANIYPYNSEKKNEFIKKGMGAFRAKVPHMEKFPKDVLTAEVRMGGNPNILSEPMFLPEKKRNYAAEVFGTPSPKSKGIKDKKRSTPGKSSTQKDAHITHRRFLGVDDYRAYICIQYPGKDRTPGDKEDEEVLRINREPEQEFNCHSCSFTTKRLEVMILHTKSHIQGVYVSSPRKTKHPSARRRKDKIKKSRSSDNVMDSDSSSSDSDYVREKKRKPKSQGTGRGKAKKFEKPKEEPKTSSDIRSELLAVWDDSDEDEEFDLTLNKSTDTDRDLSQSITDIILGKTPTSDAQKETGNQIGEENQMTDVDSTLDISQDQPGTSSGSKEEISSQESIDEAVNKKSEIIDITEPKDDAVNKSEAGIQPLKKTLSRSTENLIVDLSVDDDLETEYPIVNKMLDGKELKDAETEGKESKDAGIYKTTSEDSDKSAQKMNKDIQDAIKSCFDFDEDEEDDSALIGRTAAGRKIPRVIPPAERRKSQEITEDDLNRERILKEAEEFNRQSEGATHSEDVDATFKELMEMTAVPELPDVQNTLKCEQNFHNIKTIKFPDKPDATCSSKLEKKEPSDTASKLINPKKRFVKSFEDFELMQNEIRRKEEEAKSEAILEAAKSEVQPETSKLEETKSSMALEETIASPAVKEAKSSVAVEEAKSSVAVEETKSSPAAEEAKSEALLETAKSDASVEDANSEASLGEVISEAIVAEAKTDAIFEEAKQEVIPKALTPEVGASDEYHEDYPGEEEIELSKLKSKIMSKIIEEANITEENKTKIMSKIQDSPKEKVEQPAANAEPIKKSSHRTPRSKILELYRNDAKKQKAEELKNKKIEDDEAILKTREQAEDRLKETLIRNEAVPPKKGKWSRRGSHPKKDKNAFLLEDAIMDNVIPMQIENARAIDSVSVDNLTPSDASSNLVPKNDEILEEFKPVCIDDDKENLVKDNPPVESDRLLLTEENSNKNSSIDEENKIEEEIVTENVTGHVEEQEEALKENDFLPEKEKVGERIVSEGPSADMEIEKPVSVEEKQVESLPLTNVECDQLIEEAPSLPLNQQATEETKGEKIINDTEKTEEQEVSPIDLQVANRSEKDVLLDEKAPSPSKTVLPLNNSVSSEESVLKTIEMSPKEVVTETQQIEAEEIQPPSPSIDVITPPSPILPKDVICSPPKKSKKRKISENFPAADSIVNLDIKHLDVDFCPAEKKKKETDLDIKGVEETSSILEKPEADPNSESADKLCDHKSEINDIEAAKDSVTTPKLPEDHVAEHSKEVEIQYGSSSPESFKFSIQTNLSNLTSREEISALALATLSEIKADLEASDSNASEEKVEKIVVPPAPVPEPELVPIEGNLTVVSEHDLADGQVEITTDQVISPKRPVTLSTFSMDFSDSASDSNSNSTNDTLVEFSKCTEFSARGTEFTSKAMTKQIRKVDRKKENAYERLELLNILEGDADVEKKSKDVLSQSKAKKITVDDICDFEEHIPSQIVCAKQLNRDNSVDREYPYTEKVKTGEKSTASKLLERLTVNAAKSETRKSTGRGAKNQSHTPTTIKFNKMVGKAKSAAAAGKPVILSEQIIKPAPETPKGKAKKTLDDIEDVEAFIIHKDPKRIQEIEAVESSPSSKSGGKAKILQQTIITPAGEIIQPTVNQVQTDDNIFDINSMPIVLSDEILTPESIENMPIMLGSEQKPVVEEKTIPKRVQNRIITKTTTVTLPQPIPGKNQIIVKQSKTPRILQTVASKAIKTTPTLPSAAKPGKYIILPQSGVQAAKYVAKKSPVVKRTNIVPKTTALAPEPSGNKIMIVTNQQGQQQRLLLTPAQQKMLGYQNQKVTKTLVKGNVMQKSVLAAKSVPMVEAGTSGVISKSPSLIGQKIVVGTSPSAGLLATTTSDIVTNQGRIIKGVTKKVHPMNQKVFSGATKTQKTILIKNQHGQTVRKIQGTDDELLDKQVAEQLEAIKASSGIKFSSQPKPAEPYKAKAPVRRSYSKKTEPKPKLAPPPLSSVQPQSKPEPSTTKITLATPKKPEPVEFKSTSAFLTEDLKAPQDRPLNQLVIQDAVGNQTTITEGQILALPSETVDGQPQSYMLVTLDESGNLTPLNSEALMSLDPNLGLGGDLSNMVLQIDQGALSDKPQTIAVKATVSSEPQKVVEPEPVAPVPVPVPVPEALITTEIAAETADQKVMPVEAPQPVVPSTNGDPGQQLIVTGDPIATQKFLDSLTEGTTDLANILANADGNSILIQADGQQILINTNTDNQMMLSMNNDSLSVNESTEGGGNPIFATQPSKNQDILAAALADTDVFQQDQHAAQSKITSQLSPSNALYPMNVGNVLETSLTLSSPIMTPLEVPSTNSKKIPDDEADILTQVPKNVDLPITITDPNIAQTVANQQVASLMASDLQTNLELALPVSETTISAVSTDMNSPSYVYSLPALDESVDINQKPFNSSMPLLNEDIEEATSKPKEDDKIIEETTEDSSSSKPQVGVTSGNSFLDEEEGRFTLGGEMCSSLSEPPPEMFDLPEDNQSLLEKRNSNIPPSLQSTPDVSDNASKDDDMTDLSTQAESSNEGSCEIPLQPQIVTKSLDLSENLGSIKRSLQEPDEEENKRCKFD